ncbi:MAG TPA: transaldolase family protein [Thermoleophilia bacterium]|nr:transaldolase family protein [Thermoleophilia bacterium]
MAILLDSASLDDAAAAVRLGVVSGITTNPALMARETKEPLAHLARLLEVFPDGPICYQPTLSTPEVMEEQARAAAALAPDRVVAKLPATLEAISLAAALTAEGVGSALTAVYSPAQALLAHEAGCRWVIPYVDRAARHSAGAVVAELAAILEQLDSPTRILAASLKTAPQVVEAILDGAHEITAPLDVILGLPAHPLTESAVREFTAHWK